MPAGNPGCCQLPPIATMLWTTRSREAIEADLLLISGGVSAGKFDLVEPALARIGARFHFTGVRIQPGKPLVFGEVAKKQARFARGDRGARVAILWPSRQSGFVGGHVSAVSPRRCWRRWRAKAGIRAAVRIGAACADTDRRTQARADALSAGVCDFNPSTGAVSAS